MARQGRSHKPGAVVHVFNRVLGGRHRLKPTPKLVAGVGRVLVEMQAKHRMEILAYAFLSQHFHLVLRIRHTHQLAGFMRDVQARIAQLSDALYGGPMLFWEPRYRSQELCTDTAITNTIRYVVAHSTKEGIVRSPRHWPGPSSVRQMLDRAHAPKAWWRGLDGVRRFVSLKLSPAPQDTALGQADWARKQRALVRSIELEHEGRRFLGLAAVMATDPLWAPDPDARPERAPMVSWKCTAPDGSVDEDALTEVIEHYVAALDGRRQAVDAMVRRGMSGVEFPTSCTFPDQIPRVLRRQLIAGVSRDGRAVVMDVPDSPPAASTPRSQRRVTHAGSRRDVGLLVRHVQGHENIGEDLVPGPHSSGSADRSAAGALGPGAPDRGT